MKNPLPKANTVSSLQNVELALLVLMAAAIPLWWRAAMLIAYILIVNLVLRIVVAGRGRKCTLSRNQKASWITVALFVSVYAVSLLYSENLKEGVTSVTRHLTLVAMALFFFFSDMSYMDKRRMRFILWALTLSIAGRFLFFLGRGLYGYFFLYHDIRRLVVAYFDPMHHGYLSMYILLSLVFLYFEMDRRPRIPYIAAILLCMLMHIAYIFFTQARMGALVLVFFFILALGHQCFVKHRYVVCCLVFTVTAAILVLVVQKAPPLMTQRFMSVTKFLSADQTDDSRYYITKACFNIIESSPLIGIGAGDRMDEMEKQYTVLEIGDRYTHYPPHNQYLDTLMTVGVPGLVLLLLLLVLPLVEAFRTKNELSFFFIIIVALCALSESILERQMGLLFFGLFYGLLPYWTRNDTPVDSV